ncbi:hypothetical protein CWI36_0024p0020 [Hamiltosporidium magnivora]|uniref:Uncharacterized protein n=1 Tax=Hamiltosporidium magnivora TaxID=148818 RepID=A0A4Q9LPQ0_9MICR|nr:hypothetical protein CWI36_0024p0020 [Hamiltosporidium magnivora]
MRENKKDKITHKKIKKKNKSEIQNLLSEANIFYVKNKLNECIGLLKEIIKKSPQYFQAYYTLGLVYEEKNELENAFNCFYIAAHIKKKDYVLWKKLYEYTFILHDFYIKNGEYNKVEDKFITDERISDTHGFKSNPDLEITSTDRISEIYKERIYFISILQKKYNSPNKIKEKIDLYEILSMKDKILETKLEYIYFYGSGDIKTEGIYEKNSFIEDNFPESNSSENEEFSASNDLNTEFEYNSETNDKIENVSNETNTDFKEELIDQCLLLKEIKNTIKSNSELIRIIRKAIYFTYKCKNKKSISTEFLNSLISFSYELRDFKSLKNAFNNFAPINVKNIFIFFITFISLNRNPKCYFYEKAENIITSNSTMTTYLGNESATFKLENMEDNITNNNYDANRELKNSLDLFFFEKLMIFKESKDFLGFSNFYIIFDLIDTLFKNKNYTLSYEILEVLLQNNFTSHQINIKLEILNRMAGISISRNLKDDGIKFYLEILEILKNKKYFEIYNLKKEFSNKKLEVEGFEIANGETKDAHDSNSSFINPMFPFIFNQDRIKAIVSNLYEELGNRDLALQYSLDINDEIGHFVDDLYQSNHEKKNEFSSSECKKIRSLFHKIFFFYIENPNDDLERTLMFINTSNQLISDFMNNSYILNPKKYILQQSLGKVYDSNFEKSRLKSLHGLNVDEWFEVMKMNILCHLKLKKYEDSMNLLNRCLKSGVFKQRSDIYIQFLFLGFKYSLLNNNYGDFVNFVKKIVFYYQNASFYFFMYFFSNFFADYNRDKNFGHCQKNLQRLCKRVKENIGWPVSNTTMNNKNTLQNTSTESNNKNIQYQYKKSYYTNEFTSSLYSFNHPNTFLCLFLNSFLPRFLYSETVNYIENVTAVREKDIKTEIALSIIYFTHSKSRKINNKNHFISKGFEILKDLEKNDDYKDCSSNSNDSISIHQNKNLYNFYGCNGKCIIYYNLGRSYHTYGIIGFAEAFYKKVLKCKNVEVRKMAIFNLILIYKKNNSLNLVNEMAKLFNETAQ